MGNLYSNNKSDLGKYISLYCPLNIISAVDNYEVAESNVIDSDRRDGICVWRMRHSINVNDVVSTSQQRRVPSGLCQTVLLNLKGPLSH